MNDRMATALPTVAVLAGGLATRLGEATRQIPKCLLDLDGEPFLLHQARLLAERGVRRIVVCAGHLGDQVQEAAARLPWPTGLHVAVVRDGPRLLGTAGAVRRALPVLGDPFFVLYGDSYLPCDYRAVLDAFVRGGRPALMTVYRNEGRWESSNVQLEGSRLIRYDKENRTPAMKHLDYGLGVFRARVFEALPEGEPADLARVYARLLAGGMLDAYEVHERFYEVGSIAGLDELRQELTRRAAQARRERVSP